jgi:hypothetical protein
MHALLALLLGLAPAQTRTVELARATPAGRTVCAIAPTLLAAPTVAVMQGRTVGVPAVRWEFRRTDTLAVRAATTGAPAVTARLLDRLGRPLVDLPVTPAEAGARDDA